MNEKWWYLCRSKPFVSLRFINRLITDNLFFRYHLQHVFYISVKICISRVPKLLCRSTEYRNSCVKKKKNVIFSKNSLDLVYCNNVPVRFKFTSSTPNFSYLIVDDSKIEGRSFLHNILKGIFEHIMKRNKQSLNHCGQWIVCNLTFILFNINSTTAYKIIRIICIIGKCLKHKKIDSF